MWNILSSLASKGLWPAGHYGCYQTLVAVLSIERHLTRVNGDRRVSINIINASTLRRRISNITVGTI